MLSTFRFGLIILMFSHAKTVIIHYILYKTVTVLNAKITITVYNTTFSFILKRKWLNTLNIDMFSFLSDVNLLILQNWVGKNRETITFTVIYMYLSFPTIIYVRNQKRSLLCFLSFTKKEITGNNNFPIVRKKEKIH